MFNASFYLSAMQHTTFHSVFHSFHGLMNSINWPTFTFRVFIAQPVVEHCSTNAEATGSNLVESPKIFRAILQLL